MTKKSVKTLNREERERLRREAVVRKRPHGSRMNRADRKLVQDVWLEEFAKAGIVTLADEATHVPAVTRLYWLEHDEEFSIRYHQALAKSNDRIRAEVKRRAVDGVDKPVYYLGVQVDTIKEYSDSLLQFLAKARMPEFREKQQIEHTGSVTFIDLIREASEVAVSDD